ncbi:hypothetical protein M231_01966 [Tremella mesenterica]|uniref:Uncharacterized protein n=1 Tax=Tremella mesenterica TaxID=5217 RepID=A0A4Q1BRV8_TREME|nr:hypothetical protein M231_01966 [Tremella mesenterica]
MSSKTTEFPRGKNEEKYQLHTNIQPKPISPITYPDSSSPSDLNGISSPISQGNEESNQDAHPCTITVQRPISTWSDSTSSPITHHHQITPQTPDTPMSKSNNGQKKFRWKLSTLLSSEKESMTPTPPNTAIMGDEGNKKIRIELPLTPLQTPRSPLRSPLSWFKRASLSPLSPKGGKTDSISVALSSPGLRKSKSKNERVWVVQLDKKEGALVFSQDVEKPKSPARINSPIHSSRSVKFSLEGQIGQRSPISPSGESSHSSSGENEIWKVVCPSANEEKVILLLKGEQGVVARLEEGVDGAYVLLYPNPVVQENDVIEEEKSTEKVMLSLKEGPSEDG